MMNRETRSFQIFPSVPKGDGVVRESMVAVEKGKGGGQCMGGVARKQLSKEIKFKLKTEPCSSPDSRQQSNTSPHPSYA